MKIYLAARYSRRTELCRYRDDLHRVGHTVTSRWLNGSHQIDNRGQPLTDEGEKLIEGTDDTPEAAQLRRNFLFEDLLDLQRATALICFTEPPRSSATRGGRHVEFGYFLASRRRGKLHRILVVGPPENLFYWHPAIERFDTWPQTLDEVT